MKPRANRGWLLQVRDPNWLPLAPEGTFPADPSGNMKRLMEVQQQGLAYTLLHPGRIEIGKELFRINTEELYTISTVGFTGSRRGVYLNRNNVRNQPRTHIRDQHGFVATATYYFEEGMDNLHHPGNRSKRYKSWSFLGWRELARVTWRQSVPAVRLRHRCTGR